MKSVHQPWNWNLPLSIQSHLVLGHLSVVVPALAFIGLLLWSYADAEMQRLEIKAAEQSHRVSALVEAKLSGLRSVVVTLANDNDLKHGDYEAFYKRVKYNESYTGAHTIVSRANGEQIINTTAPIGEVLPKGRTMAEIFNEQDFDNDGVVVSHVVTGAVTKYLLISIATKARCGEETCVLRQAIKAESLMQLVPEMPEGWTVSLLDQRNQYVFRIPNFADYVSKRVRNIFVNMMSSSDTFEIVNPDGVRVKSFVTRMPNYKWTVTVSVPTKLLIAPFYGSLYVLSAVGIMLLVLTLVGAIYFGRIIREAVSALAIAAPRVAIGEQFSYLQTPVDEVNKVADAFAKAHETIRKQLNQNQLLIRETLHRAKNQLTIIQSIARQTTKHSETPEEFERRFSERLAGLSQTQDLLVKEDWNGVHINSLVESQLQHYAAEIGKRLIISGPDLVLAPEPAQNLGMALHELGSNAAKYGALSGDKGQVFVTWGVRDDKFTIDWSERGGPEVVPPTRKGFGTVVLKVLCARSLDGNVDITYEKAGLTWKLVGSAAYFVDA